MSCLDTLVSLGFCGDTVSESGFTLLRAPGITVKNLAQIAPDSSGVQLALEKKQLSLLQVQNDLIAALHAQNVVASISNPVHSSSFFNIQTNNGLGGYRGQTIHKVRQKGALRSLYIESIELYPLQTGETTLKIDDGINVFTYTGIDLTANTVNVIDSDMINGFPFKLSPNSNYVQVTVDQSNILFAKSSIICHKGCSGRVPNDCGWVDGWNGSDAVKDEGFGMNIKFKCECDYAQILCDMSKSLVGELIWLKWQINIMEEHSNSNRFNNWVVYKEDVLRSDIIPNLQSEYTAKWNALLPGMFSILKTYNDSCLNCRGIKTIVVL